MAHGLDRRNFPMKPLHLREVAIVAVACLLLGGLAGAWGYSALHSCPEIDANVRPVPAVVLTPEAQETPSLEVSEPTRPTTEIQYRPFPVRVPVYVPGQCVEEGESAVAVPVDLLPPDPIVSDADPIRVRRPVFGPSEVSFRYYDPRDGRVEQRLYNVEEHPFKYGVAAEAYQAHRLDSDGLTAAGVGVGLEGYLGWGQLHGVVRVGSDPGLGSNVQAGVRVRLGR